MPENQTPKSPEEKVASTIKEKKFDFSPAFAILAAGVMISASILFIHYFPAASPTTAANTDNTTPTLQQQMGPSLYAQIASALKIDATKYQACVDAKTYQAKIDADTAEAQKAGGDGTPFTIVLDTKTGKKLGISGALPYEQLKQAIAAVNTEGKTDIAMRAPSASDHIVGSPTAPIVLVEYSDFQCPYCKLIHPSLKQIVSESNGQVAWVYRQYPLYQIHPQATPAANAAECIASLGGNDAFWKFEQTIFEG
jgi:protein-disulfide isomerase